VICSNTLIREISRSLKTEQDKLSISWLLHCITCTVMELLTETWS